MVGSFSLQYTMSVLARKSKNVVITGIIACVIVLIGIPVTCVNYDMHYYKSWTSEYKIQKETIESSLKSEKIGGLERVELVKMAQELNKELVENQYRCQQWYGFTGDKEVLNLEPIKSSRRTEKMQDCKELRIEAETFDKLRRDADIVLQRALGTMKEKESMDGKVTITIDIKLVPEFIPNFDPAVQGETRKILKPKFDHKVTSAINIKNEEKGSVNPEMAMVWDEDKQEYVLTYVNNTEQRSIFDSDFQEAMNAPEDKEPVVPLLEGEVVDEGALPGPIDGEVGIDDFHDDDGYGYEDAV